MKVSYSFITLLTFALLIIAASAQFPCNDDDRWTFGTYKWKNSEGQMEITTRTCSWLTANPKLSSKRIQIWCDRKNRYGVAVRDKCKVTCSECVPSNIPIPDPEDCKNQPFNWRDLDGNDCDFYAQGDSCNTMFGNDRNGISAREACCACNGGCFDVRVEVTVNDGNVGIIPWYDAKGRSCEWFERNPNYLCQFWGGSYRNFGYVADKACCACGRGSERR